MCISERIRQRKARYCRYMDTRQWVAFAVLFGDNPIISSVDPDGKLSASFASVDEFTATTSSFLEGARSIHHVHNSEIEFVSDNVVSAIWSMEDLILFPSVDIRRPRSIHGYGHYHETWEGDGDDWLITRLELRRTILETQFKEARS
jgi:SnoaL-like domain